MSVLISGSIAYDYIMNFPDKFEKHILPDRIHMLNVCFVIDQLERQWGGCGMNIAYNLQLLREHNTVFSVAGRDFSPYRQRYQKMRYVDLSHVEIAKKDVTASAYIMTDQSDNQMSAFYPGATLSVLQPLRKISNKTEWIIIAPSTRETMLKHLREAAALKLSIVFDPGQNTSYFSKDEWGAIFQHVNILVVNDYEASVIRKFTGLAQKEILRQVPVLIVTLGERGSKIYANNREIRIPAVPAKKVLDPTGAGDAYRAGIIKGILHGRDWQQTGQLASLCATYAVESRGTQNHAYTLAELRERYYSTFGSALPFSFS